MNTFFYACVHFMEWMTSLTGMTYLETNVLFCNVIFDCITFSSLLIAWITFFKYFNSGNNKIIKIFGNIYLIVILSIFVGFYSLNFYNYIVNDWNVLGNHIMNVSYKTGFYIKDQIFRYVTIPTSIVLFSLIIDFIVWFCKKQKFDVKTTSVILLLLGIKPTFICLAVFPFVYFDWLLC